MQNETYLDAKVYLNSIRNENEAVFRCAISHMIDVGQRNLTEESVKESCNEIMSQDDSHKLMSNEFLCKIIETAYKIANVSTHYLFVYISQEMVFDVGSDKPSYDRLEELVNELIADYDNFSFMDNEMLYEVLSDSVGMDDDEIRYFGYGYCIPNSENQFGDGSHDRLEV